MRRNKMLVFSGLGRLTKDPVVKQVGETTVCRFSMAFSKKIKDKEYTDFFDFELWGRAGEVVNEYCQKGDQLFVSGEPRQERWEKDGQARSSVLFRVNDFRLVSGKRDANISTKPVELEETNEVPF